MKKELAIDRFLKNIINRYMYEICLCLLLLAAVFIRVKFAPETTLSPDYNDYYKVWVDYYRQNGIIKGLGNAYGDYYVPLNVMYALCSLLPMEPWLPLSIIAFVCELVSAFFIYKIFYFFTSNFKFKFSYIFFFNNFYKRLFIFIIT